MPRGVESVAMSEEAHVWGEQDEQGVSLTRLRYNLTLTDDERLERHQRAARFVLECMRAAESAGIPRLPEEPRWFRD